MSIELWRARCRLYQSRFCKQLLVQFGYNCFSYTTDGPRDRIVHELLEKIVFWEDSGFQRFKTFSSHLPRSLRFMYFEKKYFLYPSVYPKKGREESRLEGRKAMLRLSRALRFAAPEGVHRWHRAKKGRERTNLNSKQCYQECSESVLLHVFI